MNCNLYGTLGPGCAGADTLEALGVRIDLQGVFPNSHKGKLLWQTRNDDYAPVHRLSDMFRVLGKAPVATLASETQRVLSEWRAAL